MFRVSGFFQFSIRNYASPNRIKPFKKPKVVQKIEVEAISMKSKGFLRSQLPYTPPKDYQEKVQNIAAELKVEDATFKEKKFEFLNECAKAFGGHAVPNSHLYQMKSIINVVRFYRKKVSNRTPFEELDTTIANLHIIPEARRYDPETDGVSAFPKSSTLVTGLKTRKKYKGHIAKTSWP